MAKSDEKLILSVTNQDGDSYSDTFTIKKFLDQKRDNKKSICVNLINSTTVESTLDLEGYNETEDVWCPVVVDGSVQQIVSSISVFEHISGYSNFLKYRFKLSVATSTGSIKVYVIDDNVTVSSGI